jgi:NAD(P)-dependent dehydrogenase (short-subunit alcohol dehydrogenase family)
MFKDDTLAGKRILVTGGGTGLGRVMTEQYLRLGAELYICGRRKGVLDETADELMQRHGGKVHTRALDIRNADAIDEVIQSIFDEGPLDGLVNNAAGNFISPTKDLSPRGFNAIASIVFHGTFYVTHAVGTRWIEAGHKGNIISIVTTWVWTGSAYVVPSAMSKSGVHAMTMSLAAEWGPYGIRLNAIAPGPFPTKGAWERLIPGAGDIDTEAELRRTNPMGRTGEMPELANLATFLMADGCDYLTGQTIAIDGAEQLATGGNFWARLSQVTDEQWAGLREQIRQANEADKARRSV